MIVNMFDRMKFTLVAGTDIGKNAGCWVTRISHGVEGSNSSEVAADGVGDGLVSLGHRGVENAAEEETCGSTEP